MVSTKEGTGGKGVAERVASLTVFGLRTTGVNPRARSSAPGRFKETMYKAKMKVAERQPRESGRFCRKVRGDVYFFHPLACEEGLGCSSPLLL